MNQSTKPAHSTIMEGAIDTIKYAQVVYAPTLELIMREWSINTEGFRMPRLMPLKDNLKKAIMDTKDDPDRMFRIWANQMSWHHFLDKRPRISIYREKHFVTLFSETYYNNDGKWGSVNLYIHFDWIRGTIESCIIPELPDYVITRKYLWDYTGDDLVYPDIEIVSCVPWEIPGQRFLENFENVHLKGEQEE